MGTVVGSNISGEYDVARGLALYDPAGDLPQRSRDLWSLLEADSLSLAREFWVRYAKSPELKTPFDQTRLDDYANKIQPYLATKFSNIENPAWTVKAHAYVERAFTAGLTLSTLLAGLSAETEAAFVMLRRQNLDEAELVRFARTLSEVQSVEVDSSFITPSSWPAARARKSIRAAPMISTARCSASSRAAPSRAKDFGRKPRRPALRRGACSARPAKSPPPQNNPPPRCVKPPRPRPA